jgi:hypothetical protein
MKMMSVDTVNTKPSESQLSVAGFTACGLVDQYDS